jgi:DNA-binding SARP family transcriptional activator
MPAGLRFYLLGPLAVERDATVVPVNAGMQRAVLAALLLNSGRVVPVDELAEVLWGASPPPSARVSVQNLVARLRRVLGDSGHSLIATQPRGYLITVDADGLDVSQFQAVLASARTAARAGSWDQAAAQATAALSLWRGEPLEDVQSDALGLREVPRLQEMRLQAVETRLDADLHRGRHGDVVIELERLVAAYPLRERFHAQLMAALYGSGRQGEALAAYQQARSVLVEELGVEPGPELRVLHQRILAGDPVPALASPGGQAAVPQQLPAAVPGFTGRAGELTALTAMLDQAGGPGTVVISAIGGTAGVGKTALALHWAHRVAGNFPDGQLHVNLRGFDPSGVPATPAEAIRGFLDALGVPPERIPADPQAQAGLYRSLLAGKRVLIVLDNAADEQQVRPLLPASAASLVIVTSRNQLAGLAAADAARLISLDVLSHDEAVQMLTARLGADRAAAEPTAVEEIASLCACLPLALAVAVARAATRPGFPVTALAAELTDTADRLDALDAGDPATTIRAVFSWSTRQLSDEAARMFRLLGLHLGPDISVPAAASLAAVAQPQARRLLGELARAHLIAEHVPGRYALHDLLRAYAADQARTTDSQPDRDAAVRRALDHYAHTAHDAAGIIVASHRSIPMAPPSPGTAPERFTGHDQALAWFEAEYHVLRAATTLAADYGLDHHLWLISLLMHPIMATRGHDPEWAGARRMSMAAATAVAAGDIAGSEFYQWTLEYCADMAALYERLGNRRGQALCLNIMASQAEVLGHYSEALGHAEQAATLFREAGDKAREADLLNTAGWYHALLGNYQKARALCRQALALNTRYGNRHLEGNICNSLGYAEYHAGDLAEAAACYERALSIFRNIDDRWGQADTLTNLGDICHASGELLRSRKAWQQALAILDDLQHPDAEQVRARLSSTGEHARLLSPRQEMPPPGSPRRTQTT